MPEMSQPPAGQGVRRKTVVGMMDPAQPSQLVQTQPVQTQPVQAKNQHGPKSVQDSTHLIQPNQTSKPPDTVPDDPPAPPPPHDPTIVGMATPGEMSGRAHAKNKTILGVPSPASAPAFTSPVSPNQEQGDQVQLSGVKNVGLPPAQPVSPEPNRAKTILGVAMPGIAPTPKPKSTVQAPNTAPVAQASKNKTMLGVALPGIAPTQDAGPTHHAQPNVGLGEAPAPQYPGAPPAPQSPEATTSEATTEPQQPKVVRKRRIRLEAATPIYRRPAFVLAALGFSIIVLVGLFALLWPTKPPIVSKAKVNEQGKDVLELTCETCPNGTIMRVEGSKAEVTNRVAQLTLPQPLVVGDNQFTVEIDRPGSGRDESVELSIPVAYRVRPNLDGLSDDPPVFYVEVETKEGTSVRVNGTALEPDKHGKARYAVDVSKDCMGPNQNVVTIEKKIPYTIEPKGGKESKGAVSVKVGVSPMLLHSPRPHMVVDSEHFVVGGQTAQGAVVQIEGTKFEANKDGSFSRKMQIKRPGETKIRVKARLPAHAPRTITVVVKRVVDLEAEAKAFEARATTSITALMQEMQNAGKARGKEVVVRGEIVEARTQGVWRNILLDMEGKCDSPPCLATLAYAGDETLSKGDTIRAFGRVASAHTAAGKSVPLIDVDFLLKVR